MTTLDDIIEERVSALGGRVFPKPAAPAVPGYVAARMIPMEDLVVGHYYGGSCRNASVARWDGTEFTYMRTKWHRTFTETIQHPERDNQYDLFVPVIALGDLDSVVIPRTAVRPGGSVDQQDALQCAKEQNEK